MHKVLVMLAQGCEEIEASGLNISLAAHLRINPDLGMPNFNWTQNAFQVLDAGKNITIKFLDEQGKERVEEFTGLSAQIVQHEIDHLQGTLFTDHLLAEKKPLYKLGQDGQWEEVDFT